MELSSIFNALTKHTSGGSDDYNAVTKLSLDELLNLRKDLHAVMDSNMNALRFSGDVISSYNQEQAGEIDCNSAGWLVKHLAEIHAGASELLWSVENRLNYLGFDNGGYPIKGVHRGV